MANEASFIPMVLRWLSLKCTGVALRCSMFLLVLVCPWSIRKGTNVTHAYTYEWYDKDWKSFPTKLQRGTHYVYITNLVTHDWYSVPSCDGLVLNSLRPSDAIRWHKTGSTLAQVMACCLTAPSHYLNQCWLIISSVRSSDIILMAISQQLSQLLITVIGLKSTHIQFH